MLHQNQQIILLYLILQQQLSVQRPKLFNEVFVLSMANEKILLYDKF